MCRVGVSAGHLGVLPKCPVATAFRRHGEDPPSSHAATVKVTIRKNAELGCHSRFLGFSGTSLGDGAPHSVTSGAQNGSGAGAHSSTPRSTTFEAILRMFFPRGGKRKRNALLRCNSLRSNAWIAGA